MLSSLRALPRAPRLTRRVFDDGSQDGEGTGGTGGGGCCCNELKCLRVDGLPLTVPLLPEYYSFYSTNLSCRCGLDQPEQGEQRLYQVDPADDLIWETPHDGADNPPTCLGTVSIGEPCTVTAHWLWAFTTCGGSCDYIAVANGDPACNAVWPYKYVLSSSGCGGGCECPDLGPVCNILTPHPTHLGQTISRSCVTSGGGGSWSLVSTDTPTGCIPCTPDPPDYDGSADGDTAETTCESTGNAESGEQLLISFWRLTINETPTAYGCDLTKLEFIIGAKSVLTYYLATTGCNARPFCRECVNPFKVTDCRSTCLDGPTVICLEPKTPLFEPQVCSACKNNEMPGWWYFNWPIACPMQAGYYFIQSSGCGGIFKACFNCGSTAGTEVVDCGCITNIVTFTCDWYAGATYWPLKTGDGTISTVGCRAAISFSATTVSLQITPDTCLGDTIGACNPEDIVIYTATGLHLDITGCKDAIVLTKTSGNATCRGPVTYPATITIYPVLEP